MKKYNFFTLLVLLLIGLNVFAFDSKKVLVIGVVASRGESKCVEQWQPTVDYLDLLLDDYKIILKPLLYSNVEEIVNKGEIDFILCNPAMYINYEIKNYATKLASIIYLRGYKKSEFFGGVLFCKVDRKIYNIKDLAEKKLASSNKASFGGWVAVYKEFIANNFDPYQMCSKIKFLETHNSVVYAVKKNEFDAGIVRTETLERMQKEGIINLRDYRIINQNLDYQYKMNFHLLLSTKLYPEWIFAKLEKTPNSAAKKITELLFQIKENSEPAIKGNYTGFTIPANLIMVEKDLRDLRLPPYEMFPRGNFKSIVKQNNNFLIIVIVLLIFALSIMIFTFNLNRKLKISKKLLAKQLIEKEKIQEVINEESKKLKLILKYMPQGLILVSKENEIIEANDRLFDLINIPKEKFIKNSKIKELFFQWADFNNIDQNITENIIRNVIDNSSKSTEFAINEKILEIHHNFLTDGRCIHTITDITERKKYEMQLKASEERFRLIAENSSDIIWNIDKNFNFIYISPLITKVTGYSVDEYLNKKPEDVLTKESLEKVYALAKAGLENINTIKNSRLEFEHYSKDGTTIWFETSIGCILNQDGTINYYTGVSRNINEKKKFEKELKENEEKFRLTFDQSPIGAVIIDLNLDIKKTNKAFCGFLTYSENDICLLNYVDLLSNEEKENNINELVDFIKGKNINYKNEYKFYTKDKKEVWGKISVGVVKNEKNEPLYYLHLIEDITERKRTQLYIKETDMQFRQVWENSFDGMRLTDSNGTIILVNKSFCKLVKMNAQDLIGKPFSVIYLENEQKKIFERGFERLSTQIIETSFERELTLWNNEKVWFELSNSYIELENDSSLLLSIFHDITKRKTAEEAIKKYSVQLEEVNASKDKFFSIIAHELKSPFQGSLGISSLLAEDIEALDKSEISTMAASLNKSLKSQYDLLKNLLDWSRLQAGYMVYTPQKVDINEQIIKVIKLLENNFKQKNIKVTFQPINYVYAIADENMVFTVLQNLITNAIKFTNFNGNINIIVKTFDNEIETSVIDDGVGIDEKKLDNIFRIDNQHSTVGTNKETGTGLGLILCKEMIEKNKGKIWVKSKVNAGSDFSFLLPIFNSFE
ncbi:MAG: PAS domain S-box protein [bacterium]